MEMFNKLSEFIDDLIEYRFDEIKFDVYIQGRKKYKYYSLEIETNIKLKPSKLLGFQFFDNQFIRFIICVNTNEITLHRDDYEDFVFTHIDLSNKYSKIIENLYLKKLDIYLNKIVNDSYKDLNLYRESNLGNLLNK